MDDPSAEVEIKPRLKPRGSVAKEEDPKPSHQLHKRQVKSTGSTEETLCPWRCERPLRAPTGESALALMAVGSGGENTQE